MKTQINLLVIVLFCFLIESAVAQVPQAIPYQAVARDNAGNVIANQNISLRFSIREGFFGGSILYQEEQFTTTNGLGLFSLNIGQGFRLSGTFSNIDWSSGSKHLQAELDTTGGSTYVDMGTQQMLSVPFAFYAKGSDLPNVGTAGTYGSTSLVPIITTDSKGRVTSITTSTITANETDPQVSTTTTNIIPKWSGSTLVNGSIVDNGNIGIGTTSTGAKLDVLGTFKLADGTQGNGKVLTSDASGLSSWQKTGWKLSGNAGTLSTEFLGTTDNQSLRFKVNNATAGIINYDFPRNTSLGYLTLNSNATFGTDNIAIGYRAMQSNTIGGLNIAVGVEAMAANTTGNYNTAVGFQAMNKNYTGFGNTGIGANALHEDSIGTYNTASGYYALYSNLGDNNTANGSSALSQNSTGFSNTAVGANSTGSNTTGNENTAMGIFSLYYNTIGSENVAVGDSSLYRNTFGNLNTAAGTKSLYQNTFGANNTAFGYKALNLNTVGNNNTAIGYKANVSNPGLSNATAIGANAVVSANDAVVLGDNANVGIRTSAPTSALEVIGPIGMKVKSAQVAGTNHPDNSAGIWMYSSSVGTISLPSALASPNRIYILVNLTNASNVISNYKNFSSVTTNTIAANSSLWLVSDGSLWWQIK